MGSHQDKTIHFYTRLAISLFGSSTKSRGKPPRQRRTRCIKIDWMMVHSDKANKGGSKIRAIRWGLYDICSCGLTGGFGQTSVSSISIQKHPRCCHWFHAVISLHCVKHICDWICPRFRRWPLTTPTFYLIHFILRVHMML